MAVALVHDWLVTSGGGEQVLSEALKVFPGAPVHALIDHMSAEDHARLGIPRARTTWLQGVPGIRRSYRSWLPVMPVTLRSLNLDGADTILAISHAVAKSAPVRAHQKLLCLCLSPMRYAWDLREQYLHEAGLGSGLRGVAARWMLERMRRWDERTSRRVDAFASISRHIADRIRRAYGRDSEVIYPPVDTEFFTPGSRLQPRSPVERGYYLTASRFVPYKRVDLIVRAFAGTSRRLVVVGGGPDVKKVNAAAAGAPNVTFFGHVGREHLRDLLRGARAFVFAAEEDFGIAPVEAQACGVPVIAYGVGGARETVVPLGEPDASGLFFDGQTVESIRAAVDRFEANAGTLTVAACRASAERFSAERFREHLQRWVAANAA